MSQPILESVRLSVTLGGQPVLSEASLVVRAGEVVAVRGASGSGKSTLLHALCGLLTPDSGEVYLEGERIDRLKDARRARLRLTKFGVAFQSGDLIPELTVGENVSLPLRLLGLSRREASDRVRAQLKELDIEGLFDRRLDEVSGGQAQRAALARALVHRPSVVLADEPTGALDERSAANALERVVALARDYRIAAVVVTHDPDIAAACDRVVVCESGRLTGQADVASI